MKNNLFPRCLIIESFKKFFSQEEAWEFFSLITKCFTFEGTWKLTWRRKKQISRMWIKNWRKIKTFVFISWNFYARKENFFMLRKDFLIVQQWIFCSWKIFKNFFISLGLKENIFCRENSFFIQTVLKAWFTFYFKVILWVNFMIYL